MICYSVTLPTTAKLACSTLVRPGWFGYVGLRKYLPTAASTSGQEPTVINTKMRLCRT